MKFVIDGHEYEAASLERITGMHALDLPKQAGIGVQTLAKRLEEIPRLGYQDGKAVVLPAGASEIDGTAVMDSEPHLRALLAFLWLSRRLAGEPRLTFEDACSFEFSALNVVTDDEEDEAVDEVSPDPTQPSASDQADGAPA